MHVTDIIKTNKIKKAKHIKLPVRFPDQAH